MLRWYFTFKTFKGDTCRVEIYDKDWSGTAKELNKDVAGSPGCPAENPVVIDEDDSQNLLDVVRTKTGYLHLIELEEGALADMFPLTGTQLSVTIMLNNAVIFRGYVQSQTFESKYKSYRSKLDVPIVSVIGAILNEPMSDAAWGSAAGLCAFDWIFAENGFNAYTYLVMPYFDVVDDGVNHILPLKVKVPCDILSPVNDDFKFGIPDVNGDDVPQYNIMTHGEFLEAFCRFYGLTCHETGDTLLFTRPDYDGTEYIRMQINEPLDAPTVIGQCQDLTILEDEFTFEDNKGKAFGATPLCTLLIKPAEIKEEVEADFTQGEYVTFDSNRKVAVLENLNENIYSGYFITTMNPPVTSAPFVRLTGDGSSEMLEVCFSSTSVMLAKFGFYTPNFNHYNHFMMKFKDIAQGVRFKIAVRSGGKYYNFEEEGDVWVDTPTYSEAETNDKKEISWWALTNGQYTEVMLYNVERTSAIDAFITEAKMVSVYDETGRDVVSKYTEQVSRNILVKGDMASQEKDSITSPFLYRASGYYDYPRYRYMTKQQYRRKLGLRAIGSVNLLKMYINPWSVFDENSRYRLMSVSHEIATDRYELQLTTIPT